MSSRATVKCSGRRCRSEKGIMKCLEGAAGVTKGTVKCSEGTADVKARFLVCRRRAELSGGAASLRSCAFCCLGRVNQRFSFSYERK